MDTWQFISLLVTVIGSAVLVTYRQGRRDERISSGLRFLRTQTNGLYTLMGMVAHALAREKIFTEEESKQAIQTLTKTIAPEQVKNNPLTREKADRLNRYLTRLRAGEGLEAWEIEDYNALAHEMEKENPDDPNAWPLVALGAFLQGLVLGSKR